MTQLKKTSDCRDIKRIIKKDGLLFIKVPNGNYNLLKLWLSKKTGQLDNYDIFDSYEHLSHFTHKTLKRMLEEAGFYVSKIYIGQPIQLPVWHRYVGQFYQYPSPWILDAKNYIARMLFYWTSKIEFYIKGKNIGYFAPNIIAIAYRGAA